MRILGKACLVLFSYLFFLFFLNNQAFAKKYHAKSSKSQVYRIPNTTIYGLTALQAEIDKTIASVNPNLNVGVEIKSMRRGDTFYTRNTNSFFIPASILKVLTAQSALLYLGAEYKFPTIFSTDAKTIDHGILRGNLYLVHSGDPTLTYNDINELMLVLKAKNIQQISGDVYIDTSAYDQEIYGPGWISNDKRFCYAAPISASIINHNCMVMQVTPGKSVGTYANITTDSSHFFSGVLNEVVTKPQGFRSCMLHLDTTEDKGITLSGCMNKGKISQGVSAVVTNITYYNRSLIQSLFQHNEIIVNGQILPGTAPLNLPIVATHSSKPLKELVSEMLKKSDNIIAGSLFKKMGELYANQPGSWQNGSSAVRQILQQKMGVNTTRMSIIDGSGLSRNNLVSPLQMMQVLDFSYHHNETNYDFISGLPISGIDGTLKNRMQNIRSKVRAKTGTMNGVVALAGYVITKENEPLAFVIVVNGHMGMDWKYIDMINNIMTLLTRYSRI